MEEFQIDGIFSPDVYRSVLSSAGYTPSYFKQSLSEDMLLSQLRSGIAGSEFVTSSELELNSQVLLEQRDLRFFTIPLEKFASTSPPTDAEIDAYYLDHQEQFRTAESLDIDYMELTLDDYRQPVTRRLFWVLTIRLRKSFSTKHRIAYPIFCLRTDGEVTCNSVSHLRRRKLSAGLAFC